MTKTPLLLLAAALAQTASAELVFQADFNGTGGGTGGASDIVTLGGTGVMYDTSTTDGVSSAVTGGNLVVTDADIINANRRSGVAITTTTTSNGFNALFEDTSATLGFDTLNGGFDYIFKSDKASMDAKTVRPLDLFFGQGNQIRLITTTNVSGSFMIELIDYSTADTLGDPRPQTAFSSYTADTWYHMAVTLETSAAGLVTVNLFLAEGNTEISTSGTPTATVTSSGILNTEGALTNNTLYFASSDTTTAGNVNYDNFRIYNDIPDTFSAIPEPSTSALALGSLMLVGAILRRRRS
jgi:hypothetical protein